MQLSNIQLDSLVDGASKTTLPKQSAHSITEKSKYSSFDEMILPKESQTLGKKSLLNEKKEDHSLAKKKEASSLESASESVKSKPSSGEKKTTPLDAKKKEAAEFSSSSPEATDKKEDSSKAEETSASQEESFFAGLESLQQGLAALEESLNSLLEEENQDSGQIQILSVADTQELQAKWQGQVQALQQFLQGEGKLNQEMLHQWIEDLDQWIQGQNEAVSKGVFSLQEMENSPETSTILEDIAQWRDFLKEFVNSSEKTSWTKEDLDMNQLWISEDLNSPDQTQSADTAIKTMNGEWNHGLKLHKKNQEEGSASLEDIGQEKTVEIEKWTPFSLDRKNDAQVHSMIIQTKDSSFPLTTNWKNLSEAGKINLGNQILESLQEKMKGFISQNHSQIRFILNPRELGEVKLFLEMQGKDLHARITVENDTVKQVLEQRMQDLRNVLQEAGIEVQNLQIDTADKNGQKNQSQDLFDYYQQANRNRVLAQVPPQEIHSQYTQTIFGGDAFGEISGISVLA